MSLKVAFPEPLAPANNPLPPVISNRAFLAVTFVGVFPQAAPPNITSKSPLENEYVSVEVNVQHFFLAALFILQLPSVAPPATSPIPSPLTFVLVTAPASEKHSSAEQGVTGVASIVPEPLNLMTLALSGEF
ncbi:hypothetical protein [Candidatus Binatus sp.]|uniref:hypothetical protein n=1 Tax=Candidatus Binatus sp. TaxID=2811406 RepID=UPI002B491A63|nr:hypothetical protein [Candidatus Binatus sp.]